MSDVLLSSWKQIGKCLNIWHSNQIMRFNKQLIKFHHTGNGRSSQAHCIVGCSISRSVLCCTLYILANVVGHLHISYRNCTNCAQHTNNMSAVYIKQLASMWSHYVKILRIVVYLMTSGHLCELSKLSYINHSETFFCLMLQKIKQTRNKTNKRCYYFHPWWKHSEKLKPFKLTESLFPCCQPLCGKAF